MALGLGWSGPQVLIKGPGHILILSLMIILIIIILILILVLVLVLVLVLILIAFHNVPSMATSSCRGAGRPPTC